MSVKIFEAAFEAPQGRYETAFGSDREKLVAHVFRCWPTVNKVETCEAAFDPQCGLLLGTHRASELHRRAS